MAFKIIRELPIAGASVFYDGSEWLVESVVVKKDPLLSLVKYMSGATLKLPMMQLPYSSNRKYFDMIDTSALDGAPGRVD